MTHRDGHRAAVVAAAADPSDGGPRRWDRVLFCAPEAVYTAWFPVTHQWLDLVDVSISLQPDHAFSARACVERSDAATVERDESGSRWLLGRGLLLVVT